jgi:hypothetical protein
VPDESEGQPQTVPTHSNGAKLTVPFIALEQRRLKAARLLSQGVQLLESPSKTGVYLKEITKTPIRGFAHFPVVRGITQKDPSAIGL